MAKKQKETLGQFVGRVMEEKGLSRRRVEESSEGAIKADYVGLIISGEAKKPTDEKIKSLARGIGVDEKTLLRIAHRKRVEQRTCALNADDWSRKKIAEITDWMLTRPDLIDSLMGLKELGDEEQRLIIDVVKSIVNMLRR